jgi:MFS family permease
MTKQKMIQNHREKLNRPFIRIISLSSFILGISAAFILYMESDYFKISSKSDNVTPFFITAYAIALWLIFSWQYLINKFGKKKVFLYDLFVKALIVLVLYFLPVGKIGAFFLMAYIIITVISWIDLDILLEECSRDKKTGRIRGAYLSIMNAGYFIAPLLAGQMIDRWGIRSVFAVAFFLNLIIWTLCFAKLKHVSMAPIENISFLKLIKVVIKRKNVLRIYYISFLLEFFYALMIIYTPLYLLGMGFSWTEIGKIFTVMLLPFVLFQYPAGYLADKKFEERDMIILSLVVMSVSTAVIFFISSHSVFLWAGVLFCTRIGASLIEILRDSYFYKRIDCLDVDIINFFRSVRPMAYIIGLLIAAPVAYYLHVRFIFPLVSLVMITGLLATKNLASSRIPPQFTKDKEKITKT